MGTFVMLKSVLDGICLSVRLGCLSGCHLNIAMIVVDVGCVLLLFTMCAKFC